MYTTAKCQYCKKFKHYLEEHGFEYEAVPVDTDPAAVQKMFDISGQLGVPFTIITDDKGEKHHILGFNQPQIDEILKINIK